MKVNFSDLLDNYTQKDCFADDKADKAQLKAVKTIVRQQLKGEEKMVSRRKNRIIFALATVAALTLGTISVNAATDGQLLDSVTSTITAWFVAPDGTKSQVELEKIGESTDPNGNKAITYRVTDSTEMSVKKDTQGNVTDVNVQVNKEENSTTEITVADDINGEAKVKGVNIDIQK